ncbi:hypothetical protein K439DRAFT_1638493 [Ramaria rubella]|nr:hypothetical protein K439DRAFT_1638493 [Ramaria rubella]
MASGSTRDSPTTYRSLVSTRRTVPEEESDSDVDGLLCVFSLIAETVEESEEEDMDKSGLPCQVDRRTKETLRCRCRRY